MELYGLLHVSRIFCTIDQRLNNHSDNINQRTLSATQPASNVMTIEMCQASCSAGGYKYAGVESVIPFTPVISCLWRTDGASNAIVPTQSLWELVQPLMAAATWHALVRRFYLTTTDSNNILREPCSNLWWRKRHQHV